jgi:hypothetical protein
MFSSLASPALALAPCRSRFPDARFVYGGKPDWSVQGPVWRFHFGQVISFTVVLGAAAMSVGGNRFSRACRDLNRLASDAADLQNLAFHMQALHLAPLSFR